MIINMPAYRPSFALFRNPAPRAVSIWELCLFLSICLITLQSIAQEQPNTPTANQKTAGDQRAADRNKLEFFESRIRPVLVSQCFECHSDNEKTRKGGLSLASRKGIEAGGDSGRLLDVASPDNSLILSALRHEDLEMPPDQRLDERVLKDFRRWIGDGAVLPADYGKRNSAPAKFGSPQRLTLEQSSDFWSFRMPHRQQPPGVRDRSWPKNRIDIFILARMESRNLLPAPQASRKTLNHRLSMDLIGLPAENPSTDPDVLIDRLLASPAFGEHWARLWLDVSRYAEDQAHIVGNNKSLFYPNAYRYRDWVIEAFNSDLPYDRFVIDQLAVDLRMAAENSQPDDSDLAALGFLGLGPKYYRRNDPQVMADEWEDRIDTVCRGLLGLTVACARCHDHKYDPITTRDYYALAGIFASTEMYNKPITTKTFTKNQSDGNKKTRNKKNSPAESLHIIRDARSVRDLQVFIRGDVNNRGDKVERRFLSVFSESAIPVDHGKSGRLELARSIASRRNPLFARIMVNRVWDRLIGKPLVGTPSNFGLLGERPTHPELLDDLAARFMDNDFSLKWLIREIVESQTYQQSSRGSEPSVRQDPENRFLCRMNRKPLTIEQWRDTILLRTGQLDRTVSGPSIRPDDVNSGRRTVYSGISRFQLAEMLALFDFPDPNAHSSRRLTTITPLQKLFALNHRFLIHHSRLLADRIGSDGKGLGDGEFVQRAFATIFDRAARQEEIEATTDFLKQYSPIPEESRAALIQALFISNETLFLD